MNYHCISQIKQSSKENETFCQNQLNWSQEENLKDFLGRKTFVNFYSHKANFCKDPYTWLTK